MYLLLLGVTGVGECGKNATDERLIQSMLHITGLYKRIRKSN